MVSIYIEHVITYIYLRGGLEKRGFKMWRSIQKKSANNVSISCSVKSKARKKIY